VSSAVQIPTVISLIEGLQRRFVQNLESMAIRHGEGRRFAQVEWLRDEGRHGGGIRLEAPTGDLFNAGSVNFSHVHYDDEPHRPLRSATAISTIIHPRNPHAPSIHVHLSWTDLKTGNGYWRIMADLNPSHPNDAFKGRFLDLLTKFGGSHLQEALAEGERYFFIPALGRHRGVMHFYLEEFRGSSFEDDVRFCDRLIGGVFDLYPHLVSDALTLHPQFDATALGRQLDYHTLYFLQVLTLDRGTTAGLMVHNQNDVGTLGSLPTQVDRSLLESWVGRHNALQAELLRELIAVFPAGPIVQVGPLEKQRLADAVRNFYRRHPEALQQQAAGSKVPRTVANHDGTSR
jgi:coproporphyrinogen III oxidase